MIDYKINSHLLYSFEKKENRRGKALTLLFLLSESISLFDYFEKIKELDKIEEVDSRHYQLSRHCELLFYIPQDSISIIPAGLLNKLFFYVDLLCQSNKSKQERKALFEETKEYFEQQRLNFFVMEKRLSPFDKIEPTFDTASLIRFIKNLWKKLTKKTFDYLIKYSSDERILLFLLQKKNPIMKTFGKKKTHDLLSIIKKEKKVAIENRLLEKYKRRGFLVAVEKSLKS